MNFRFGLLDINKYIGDSGWIGLWHQGWYESSKFNRMHTWAIECRQLRFDGFLNFGPKTRDSILCAQPQTPQDLNLKPHSISELKFFWRIMKLSFTEYHHWHANLSDDCLGIMGHATRENWRRVHDVSLSTSWHGLDTCTFCKVCWCKFMLRNGIGVPVPFEMKWNEIDFKV